jgi:hypothetical protein
MLGHWHAEERLLIVEDDSGQRVLATLGCFAVEDVLYYLKERRLWGQVVPNRQFDVVKYDPLIHDIWELML